MQLAPHTNFLSTQIQVFMDPLIALSKDVQTSEIWPHTFFIYFG